MPTSREEQLQLHMVQFDLKLSLGTPEINILGYSKVWLTSPKYIDNEMCIKVGGHVSRGLEGRGTLEMQWSRGMSNFEFGSEQCRRLSARFWNVFVDKNKQTNHEYQRVFLMTSTRNERLWCTLFQQCPLVHHNIDLSITIIDNFIMHKARLYCKENDKAGFMVYKQFISSHVWSKVFVFFCHLSNSNVFLKGQ